MKSFLDAYKTYESVPTRQDISNLDAHLRRRDALYRSLGIVPAHLEGKQLLEFGPGSGENSIFLASLKPSRYTLVDGTESSIRSLQEIRAKYYPHINAEMVHAEFLQFQSVEKYDAVFCEGAIPTQADPIPLLQHIASFVKPGGVLVITTVDAVSFLSEAIRRFLARLYIGSLQLDISHVPNLVEFFKNDLDTLQGMSRRREDWVIDQIIHPWNGPPFSIPEALETLGSAFSAHGASPRFFTDWRWYKSINQQDDGFSSTLKKCYLARLHNFLDWRFSLPDADPDHNAKLLVWSRKVYDMLFDMESGSTPFLAPPIMECLQNILVECPQIHDSTKIGITSAIQSLEHSKNLTNCPLLGWWGRGQQYLSLVKRL
jgi:ubiquinone/menaquinone biosynthesis C-methylase UbiE